MRLVPLSSRWRGDPRAPEAALRHAAAGASSGKTARAWLWVSVSNDAVSFHIVAQRAAQKLFGDALLDTVIVCDR